MSVCEVLAHVHWMIESIEASSITEPSGKKISSKLTTQLYSRNTVHIWLSRCILQPRSNDYSTPIKVVERKLPRACALQLSPSSTPHMPAMMRTCICNDIRCYETTRELPPSWYIPHECPIYQEYFCIHTGQRQLNLYHNRTWTTQNHVLLQLSPSGAQGSRR